MTDVESQPIAPALDEREDDELEPFRSSRSYLSLTTYRRDGSPVTTPVWCVVDGEHVLMRTDSESYKVRRLRENPSVAIAACDSRGKLRSETIAADAKELPASERKRIERLLLRKYPIGLGAEIAFLRPVHALAGALGRGRKRGHPLFFELRPSRSSFVGRTMLAVCPWLGDFLSTAAATV